MWNIIEGIDIIYWITQPIIICSIYENDLMRVLLILFTNYYILNHMPNLSEGYHINCILLW